MAEGTIKALTDRGFGFIADEGARRGLFFHVTALWGVRFDELVQGDEDSKQYRSCHEPQSV